jgi:hypothetical protein
VREQELPEKLEGVVLSLKGRLRGFIKTHYGSSFSKEELWQVREKI